MIDIISLPSILLKDANKFEYKYQQTVDAMNESQIKFFIPQVLKFLYVNYHQKYKGKTHSLKTLMLLHRKFFRIK